MHKSHAGITTIALLSGFLSIGGFASTYRMFSYLSMGYVSILPVLAALIITILSAVTCIGLLLKQKWSLYTFVCLVLLMALMSYEINLRFGVSWLLYYIFVFFLLVILALLSRFIFRQLRVRPDKSAQQYTISM